MTPLPFLTWMLFSWEPIMIKIKFSFLCIATLFSMLEFNHLSLSTMNWSNEISSYVPVFDFKQEFVKMLSCVKKNSIIKGLKHDHKSKIFSTSNPLSRKIVLFKFKNFMPTICIHSTGISTILRMPIYKFSSHKKKKQDWETLHSHWQRRFFFKNGCPY